MTDPIEYCQQNHNLIVDTFNLLKNNNNKWPETNLYSGDWRSIPLRYDYKTVIPTLLDDFLKQTSIAMFSILGPSTELKKHKGHLGYCEHIKRYHYCIHESEDNVLVVNYEPYVWQEGEGFWFDDSQDHWGWNRGLKDRVILMFDIPNDPTNPPAMTATMNERFNDRIF